MAAALAKGFADGEPRIVNLSLGGHSDHDELPLAMSAIVRDRRLRNGRVVLVASARNDGTRRRSSPTAFNEVPDPPSSPTPPFGQRAGSP